MSRAAQDAAVSLPPALSTPSPVRNNVRHVSCQRLHEPSCARALQAQYADAARADAAASRHCMRPVGIAYLALVYRTV